MARVLKIWRSWSVRRRLLVVGGAGAVVVAGAAVAAYLALKRPADVSNPGAAFHEQDVSAFDYANLPCWLVFDQGYVDRYGFGTLGGRPGAAPPTRCDADNFSCSRIEPIKS